MNDTPRNMILSNQTIFHNVPNYEYIFIYIIIHILNSGGSGGKMPGCIPPTSLNLFFKQSRYIYSLCYVILQKLPKIQDFQINFNKIFRYFVKGKFVRNCTCSEPVMFNAHSVCYSVIALMLGGIWWMYPPTGVNHCLGIS